MSDVYVVYRERLAQLVEQRDAINASIFPLVEELEKLNLDAEAARLAAEAKAKEISDLRGGQAYLDLKKEIAALATMLSGKRAK
jgi:uncharacterized coiled-coil DUF342 family protein